MAGVDLQAGRGGEAGGRGNAVQLGATLLAGGGIGIAARVELDDGRTRARRCLDLPLVGVDEQACPDAVVPEAVAGLGNGVEVRCARRGRPPW